MMHYTTAQSLGRARIADRHHQARRDALARAARQARRARRQQSGQGGPGVGTVVTAWTRRPRAGAREPVMAPGGHPGRARCCPSRPLVAAVIPPAAGRPHPTDLLCGHRHHLACRNALQGSGAAVWLCWPDPETRSER